MSKRILLADDSTAAQKSIEKAISSADYQLIVAEDGRSAVEQIRERRPHLVLAHAMLPEVDGYEVCRQVKETPQTSHIPVLLLTGTFEPFDINRAKEVRYDGFITKPVDDRELLADISRAIDAAVYPAEEPAAAPEGEVSSADPADGSADMLDRIFPDEEPSADLSDDVDTVSVSESVEEDIFSIIDPMPDPPAAPEDEEEGRPAGAAGEEAAEPSGESADRSSADFGVWDTGIAGIHEETALVEEAPAKDEDDGDTVVLEQPSEEPEKDEDQTDLSWFLKKYEDSPKPVAGEDGGETISVDEDQATSDLSTEDGFFAPPLDPPETPAEAVDPDAEPDTAPVEAAETLEPNPVTVSPLAPDTAAEETTVPELDDSQVDRIARRVAELLSDKVVRDVAWEAVPEIAERLIRERIKEIEAEAETSS